MMKNVHVGWGPVGMTIIKVGEGKKIQLNKSKLTGIKDTKYQLTIVSPNEGVPVWQSSNEQIAKVDQHGIVTFLKEGNAVITVTVGAFKSGNTSTSVLVAIKQPPTNRKQVIKSTSILLFNENCIILFSI